MHLASEHARTLAEAVCYRALATDAEAYLLHRVQPKFYALCVLKSGLSKLQP